jgi:hypothetical protein
VPRWTRWTAALWIFGFGTSGLMPGTPLDPQKWPAWLTSPILIAIFASFIVAPLYRYRRASDPVQRQQMKWVVFGLILAILSFILGGLPQTFLSSQLRNPQAAVVYDLSSLTAVLLCFSLLPVFFGIAILRYRLWDVDVLVNRTLVYGSLTVCLAAVYVGGVVSLQSAFRAATGQSSNLAIAISTLVIAALFTPLRTRIQTLIDRRFYRRKYDAVRTITAFQSLLRDEVDLDRLTVDLLAVVQETVQPAHASLWIRPPLAVRNEMSRD